MPRSFKSQVTNSANSPRLWDEREARVVEGKRGRRTAPLTCPRAQMLGTEMFPIIPGVVSILRCRGMRNEARRDEERIPAFPISSGSV